MQPNPGYPSGPFGGGITDIVRQAVRRVVGPAGQSPSIPPVGWPRNVLTPAQLASVQAVVQGQFGQRYQPHYIESLANRAAVSLIRQDIFASYAIQNQVVNLSGALGFPRTGPLIRVRVDVIYGPPGPAQTAIATWVTIPSSGNAGSLARMLRDRAEAYVRRLIADSPGLADRVQGQPTAYDLCDFRVIGP